MLVMDGPPFRLLADFTITTGCAAPVAPGALLGWPYMASFASTAKATASFALLSKPSCSLVITSQPGRQSAIWASSVGVHAAAPAHDHPVRLDGAVIPHARADALRRKAGGGGQHIPQRHIQLVGFLQQLFHIGITVHFAAGSFGRGALQVFRPASSRLTGRG